MNKALRRDEKGLVSITVVIIIMLILSLIIISFARMVRREQRQALDRQLNTQAFYAAETGINEAIKALSEDTTLATTDYTGCNDFAAATQASALATDMNPNLGDNTTSYSCVLVDATPTVLSYDEIGTQESQIVPISPKGPDNVASVKLSWEDISGTKQDAGCPTVSPAVFTAGWYGNCSPGVLRVDIVTFDTAQTRDQLSGTSMGTVYIVPRASMAASTIALGSIIGTAQGQVVNGSCDAGATLHCSATINGMNTRNTYLRIKSIYRSHKVLVTGNSSGGTALELAGAQATVDATGKANDVLRRIQVRVPIFQTDPAAEFALESTNSICKRIVDNGSSVSIDAPSITGVDASCNPF